MDGGGVKRRAFDPKHDIRQAIETHFVGPTNRHLDPRISARCSAKRMLVPWDAVLTPSENAHAAALILVKKLEWDARSGKGFRGRWVTGSTVNGWVSVFVPEEV